MEMEDGGSGKNEKRIKDIPSVEAHFAEVNRLCEKFQKNFASRARLFPATEAG